MDTEQILAELKGERERLNRAVALLQGHSEISTRKTRRGPRHMSADARRRISEAQKKRWAHRKSGEKGTAGAVSAVPAPKRKGISAAGRKKLSAMMKKRWAERRKKAA